MENKTYFKIFRRFKIGVQKKRLVQSILLRFICISLIYKTTNNIKPLTKIQITN